MLLRIVAVPVVALVVGLLAGCSGTGAQLSGGPGSTGVPGENALVLRGAGATFPGILYQTWFRDYATKTPGVFISYDRVGSGEGIRRFVGEGVDLAERVDFGASDAAMTDAEMAKVKAGVQLVPMTAGAVAIAYNLPGLKSPLRLSRQACAALFLGRVSRWNDPLLAACNPGVELPNLNIFIVARQDSSGTTFAFTKHLDAISPEWRNRYGAQKSVDWPGHAMRVNGNEGVAGRIDRSEGSIGYVGYEFARRLNLSMAALENKAGAFVLPTDESATAALATLELPPNLRLFEPDPPGASSYPIVTLTWVLLYRRYEDPQKAEALRGLFRWCLQDGQRYSRDFGFVRLPDTVVERSLEALKNIGP